ncbi:unnamed protein product [Aureobasidium mustum]|uniref:Uncharacterized protein n=1 Tax=Aureobasidium mustum TaxID=2773714 RepID=A0A9N8K126_9PEZI|nr:unnamed protein product [Aureobasidium mustum]
MPPSIAQLTDESDADLDSIETKIEKNMKDIAYLKASSDPPALEILFLTNLQSEQRNFTERLETLHESQQKLLKKLNAIKSKNYVQEIDNLRAEKQLLQQDSGILSGEDAPDTTP